MDDKTPILTLRGIQKRFGDVKALGGIDLEVMPGEFLTLLGPSGCGKTTALRVIAGLENPDEGQVILDGQVINDLPPEKRPVNTVFQNLALFPHMNVEKNVGYGLRIRGAEKKEIATRVKEALALVKLEGVEKRMPDQLSGGQKQRVALARSLVLRPRVLLLDEPLSALDMHLRRHMHKELKRMQRELGITFLYITHDQEEALNLSDRIALMESGRFVQLGTPKELYDAPQSRFAATFIGQSNLIRGVVESADGERAVLAANGMKLPCANKNGLKEGSEAALCVRVERLYYALEAPDGFSVPGMVVEHEYAGGVQRAVIELAGGQRLTAQRQAENKQDCPVGSPVHAWWDTASAALVPWEAQDEK